MTMMTRYDAVIMRTIIALPTEQVTDLDALCRRDGISRAEAVRSDAEADVIDLFLREFRVIEVTRQLARQAIDIRRRARVRLPDAIIWATAQLESAPLITRNTKDFPAGAEGIRVPYSC